jgi:U4/U6.U5 tri-snRNP-associated protein 1
VIGKSLGELLADEEDDAASWVNKARVVQEDQITKEKELAIQRALELEARDKEIEHTSADLKGLKVAHNFENFQDIGEGVILTLKDTNILKDANSLNEEEADLENIKITEKERLKKYIEMKKKKPVYNAYEEDSNKSILPQYDDEKKESAGFMISNHGRIVSQNQLEEIRQKLSATKVKNTPTLTLDSSKVLASEYMTQDEESAIKFKKSSSSSGTKKKKKLRKKALDELVPEESGQDRGSRGESAKIKAEELKETLEKEKREKSYQKAINKAQSSLATEEEEEEDISSIILAKQKASQKKKESEDAIMQRVQLAAKQREQQQKQTPEDQSLIFTSTTEFVRAIQPLESSAPAAPERDKEIMEDIEDHEKMLQQANKKRKQREQEAVKEEQEESHEVIVKEEIKKEEEVEEEEIIPFDVLEDHTRSGGMAAVLRMLQHKKPSDDLMWAGRRTDEKPGGAAADKGDPAPHIKLEYKDEFGRIRTPKEEFRALSHKFHGKRPGKNKQEKRQKQYDEDMKKLQVLNESTTAVQAMQAEQEKRATPYLILGASIKSL